jgi:hypothetical protein
MTTQRIRCPFKIVLVGVTFQCQDKLGHWFPCWNEPEGCGGEARISWKPTSQDLLEEIKKNKPDACGEGK